MRIGTIVSAASAIVLVVFLAAFRRHPARQERRRQRKKESGPTEEELQKDLENAEDYDQAVLPTRCTTMMTSSSRSNSSNLPPIMGAGSSGDSSLDSIQTRPRLLITLTKSLEEAADNADDEKEVPGEGLELMMDLGSLKSLSADSA
jgi:hypothetical protein